MLAMSKVILIIMDFWLTKNWIVFGLYLRSLLMNSIAFNNCSIPETLHISSGKIRVIGYLATFCLFLWIELRISKCIWFFHKNTFQMLVNQLGKANYMENMLHFRIRENWHYTSELCALVVEVGCAVHCICASSWE